MARATKAVSANPDIWLAAGVRTPFAKAGGVLAKKDALELSVPVVKAMLAKGGRPDLMNWGAVIPNLTVSNLAREALISAGGDPTIPASSTIMACSTSMAGAFQAAGMLDDRTRSLALVGGAESMSRIQIGLSQPLSDDLRRFIEAKSLAERWSAITAVKTADLKLFIPEIKNRATGKSMGEHTEDMAKGWQISRAEQDMIALSSHKQAAAAWDRGFFDDLVLRLDDVGRDTTVRPDTSLEKLAKLKPSFDKSGEGSLTAGNSSPLTDGAAGVWVATAKGLERLAADVPWTTRSTPSTSSTSTS